MAIVAVSAVRGLASGSQRIKPRVVARTVAAAAIAMAISGMTGIATRRAIAPVCHGCGMEQQQQPPDAHEGSGDDVGGDGASRVGGGQLSGERVRDCFRCTELTDGSPDGFGFGESVGDVVADGVIEAVAEFGTNLLAATVWPT